MLEERRDLYRAQRDFLVPQLQALGFDIPVLPEGAFYIYANCSRFTDDSYALLLGRAGEGRRRDHARPGFRRQ